MQLLHVLTRPDGTAGVVRRIDQNRTRFGVDGGGDLAEIRPKGAGSERHAHRDATGQVDAGHVAVVAGLQHDDFVAWMHDGQNCRDDRLSGSGGDGDLCVAFIALAVHRLNFCGDRFTQAGHARHRRVLVQAALHGGGDVVDQGRVAVEIGETLSQIHRFVLGGQGGHHCKNRGADGGQFALQCGGDVDRHGQVQSSVVCRRGHRLVNHRAC